MKKVFLVALLALVVCGYGCSPETFSKNEGIGVVFDGTAMIFDQSVVFMGTEAGQILSSEWANGVTRLTISLDDADRALQASNMAAVVKNGRLNLVVLGGAGQATDAPDCILGFSNTMKYRWFKIKNLIGNINNAASREIQWLNTLHGLQG